MVYLNIKLHFVNIRGVKGEGVMDDSNYRGCISINSPFLSRYEVRLPVDLLNDEDSKGILMTTLELSRSFAVGFQRS